MILFHMLLCYLDNPVTIPQVEKKNVSVPSTNIQFEFETTDKLDEILQTEYGQVCTLLSNCVVYYVIGCQCTQMYSSLPLMIHIQ